MSNFGVSVVETSGSATTVKYCPSLGKYKLYFIFLSVVCIATGYGLDDQGVGV
jgi:hypothetical protein